MTEPPVQRGLVHHVEVWVPDLSTALPRWSWLLGQLGYQSFQSWERGASYRFGPTYLVLEQSPALTGGWHERLRPGVNHIAFHAGSRSDVDHLVNTGAEHGWQLLFPELHPFAGGPQHYAGYLQDADGYEVELVAG